MKITLHPGDVLADALSTFRPAKSIKIIFITEWDFGHTVLVNEKSFDHYLANTGDSFSEMPRLDLSNASVDSDLIVEIIRQ